MVKKLANDFNISAEELSRIQSEKEKVLALSEIKYHAKAIIQLTDKLREIDPSYSDVSVKEVIKFLLARHGNSETFDEIYNYIENIQESFFEKVIDTFKEED